MPNRQSGNSGMIYVDRGDPASYDFETGDFTTDGNIHDLDISAIVPANAKVVHGCLRVTDDLIDQYAGVLAKGHTNTHNRYNVVTVVSNKESSIAFTLPVVDGKIAYWANSIVWTLMRLQITGYWIL